MADFGTKAGDIVDNITVTTETEQIILYGEDGIGNRSEIESIVPTRNDIVDSFLNNDIYITKDGNQVNVITIMRGNPDYMHEVMEYNGNEQQTEIAILRYLRNNKDSDFVQNTLLQDEDVIEVIDSYNYLDLSRYTVCNTMAVNDGLDFYHDYSSMMRSTVTVKQVQQVDANGNPIWVVYKPNPHNVTAEQLPVTVNDPNDPTNIDLEEPYIRQYNVDSAIKELFNRINASED
jgi:hypothetical protein